MSQTSDSDQLILLSYTFIAHTKEIRDGLAKATKLVFTYIFIQSLSQTFFSFCLWNECK